MSYNATNELKELDEYYPDSDLKHIYIKHRQEIVLLLSTIEYVWQNKRLDKQNFDILFRGIQNSWVVVYYYVVGEQLNLMLGKIDGIEELLTKGIEDKSWQTRFNTIVIMKGITNRKIQNKIIGLGLKDKSKKVVEMASDVKNYYLK